MKMVPLLCYWDGHIFRGQEGTCYSDPPKTMLVVADNINFMQLIDQIYTTTGWDSTVFRVKVSGRFLTHLNPRVHVAVPISSDDSWNLFLSRLGNGGSQCIELYLSREEIRGMDILLASNETSNDPHMDKGILGSCAFVHHLPVHCEKLNEEHSSSQHPIHNRVPNAPSTSDKVFQHNFCGVGDGAHDNQPPSSANQLMDSDNCSKDGELEAAVDLHVAPGMVLTESGALPTQPTALSTDNDKELNIDVGEENGAVTHVKAQAPPKFTSGAEINDCLNNDCSPGNLYPHVPTEIAVGQRFSSKDEVKHHLALYALNVQQPHLVVKSTKTLFEVKCRQSDACPFHMRVIQSKNKDYFEVRTFKGPHTCAKSSLSADHVQLSSNLIANEIKELVKANASISIAAIMEHVQTRFQYQISYQKAWQGKRKAVQLSYMQNSTFTGSCFGLEDAR